MPYTKRKFRKYRKYNRNKINRNDIKSLKLLSKKDRGNKKLFMKNTAYKHGDIIAPIYLTPMDYVEHGVSYNPAGGTVYTETVWRGNSLRDPRFATGGHQPLGFDQLASLYFNYRVYGSAIQILMTPTDSAPSVQNLVVVVYPSNISTVAANFEEAMEQPYAKVMYRNLYSGNPKLKSYIDTATITGVRKETIEVDDSYQSVSSTEPATQWFWHVGLSCQNNVSTPTAYASIKIRYYTEWFNRIPLAQS